jgi:hypothetical protein
MKNLEDEISAISAEHPDLKLRKMAGISWRHGRRTPAEVAGLVGELLNVGTACAMHYPISEVDLMGGDARAVAPPGAAAAPGAAAGAAPAAAPPPGPAPVPPLVHKPGADYDCERTKCWFSGLTVLCCTAHWFALLALAGTMRSCCLATDLFPFVAGPREGGFSKTTPGHVEVATAVLRCLMRHLGATVLSIASGACYDGIKLILSLSLRKRRILSLRARSSRSTSRSVAGPGRRSCSSLTTCCCPRTSSSRASTCGCSVEMSMRLS